MRKWKKPQLPLLAVSAGELTSCAPGCLPGCLALCLPGFPARSKWLSNGKNMAGWLAHWLVHYLAGALVMLRELNEVGCCLAPLCRSYIWKAQASLLPSISFVYDYLPPKLPSHAYFRAPPSTVGRGPRTASSVRCSIVAFLARSRAASPPTPAVHLDTPARVSLPPRPASRDSGQGRPAALNLCGASTWQG